jgi:hypothetical protein
MCKKKIVRANGAGVFFGNVAEENEQAQTVVMTDVKRLWYWDGASSLSELAEHGVACPEKCKFTCNVSRIKVYNVLEILDVTEEAEASINGVKEWKQRIE